MMEGTPPLMPSTTELLYTYARVEEWWCDDVVGSKEERRRCERSGQRHRRSRGGRGIGGSTGERRVGSEQKKYKAEAEVDRGGRGRWEGACVGPSGRRGTGARWTREPKADAAGQRKKGQSIFFLTSYTLFRGIEMR
jgi:hypothetical protein